jgi:hypothetical protein
MFKHIRVAMIAFMGTVAVASGTSADTDGEKLLKSADKLVKARDYDAAIALLKTSFKESPGLWTQLKLAEVYILAKKEDAALGELDQIQAALSKKEREKGPLSAKDRELLKASNDKIDQLVRGTKEVNEVNRKVIKIYADLGRKMVSQKDFRSARLACKQIEKLDPQSDEGLKLSALIQSMSGGSSEGWKDLTAFEVSLKQCHGDGFGLNRVPAYAEPRFLELKKAGFEKCIFLHPMDKLQSFVVLNLPTPITMFKASIAVISKSEGDAIFKVFVKDQEVYSSEPMKAGESPKLVSFTFPSTREIKLVTDSNGSSASDHCIWLDPVVK